MSTRQVHEEEKMRKQQGEMSFFDHISELRKHILRAALAISLLAILAFLNKSFVFDSLILGPKSPNFITYRVICQFSEWVGLGNGLCFAPPEFKLSTIRMGEVLMQHLYVSFWLGIIGAFPFILWEIWKFISPGLHPHERKAARGVIFTCTLLFIFGVTFGYFIIAPFSISFLAGYTLEGLEVSPSLDSYVTYMTMFTVPIGLIFEMPVMAWFLTRIGIIGPATMREYRRHAVVVLLIIAAIITPPDVVSQTLVGIPLYALYEVSIWVSARVAKKRNQMALEPVEDLD